MPLHPQIEGLLRQAAAMGGRPIYEMTLPQARASLAMLMGFGGRSTVTLAGIADRAIPGPAGEIPLRIYTPEGAGPFPILCFFHGGGFVLGDLRSYDGVCKEMAAGAGCIVVSVDYRLAPEHAFPAAPQDAEAALRWVADHAAEIDGDPTRIAIGGDSAGGNLTAGLAQRVREHGGPALVGQLLVYPALRMVGEATASMRDNAEGYFLTVKDMEWFLAQYLTDPEHAHDLLASPALATDLAGLPPALVITAEYDPLRDDGEAYGRALADAGVPTAISRYDGAIHGFWTFFSLLSLGRDALTETNSWLRGRFATS
ncbi:MAG: alpha/beta hydrolase [Sporichthyaceae bacterium]